MYAFESYSRKFENHIFPSKNCLKANKKQPKLFFGKNVVVVSKSKTELWTVFLKKKFKQSLNALHINNNVVKNK